MAEHEADLSEGLKIHYKGALDNIIFLKNQQWRITNHALIAYAAIVALAKDTTDIERTLLTVIGFGGWAYATLCMVHTQVSMTKYYGNLFDFHQRYFTADQRETFRLHKKRPTFNYNWMFIWGLLVTNFLAAAVAGYFVWAKNGLPVLHSTPLAMPPTRPINPASNSSASVVWAVSAQGTSSASATYGNAYRL